MDRPSLLRAVIALLAVASPAAAGTVYVPLPGVEAVGDAHWKPAILIGNGATGAQEYKSLFLAADTDGTERTTVPTSAQLAAGATGGLLPAAGDAGLLELQGADPIAFAAKLVRVGQPDSAGVYLPVLSSENLFAANDVIFVQGIRRTASTATDWILVNLGHAPAQCRLRVFHGDGVQVGSSATVSMPPLSLRVYADFLTAFAVTEAANVRVDASCTQPFSSYALSRDAGTGDIAVLGPSGAGDSTLVLPGDDAPTGCPLDGSCFSVPGLVHRPTPAHPLQRVTFPVPPGSYRRIHFQMDVTHGGWNSTNPAALHMLFWLVKNRNFFMYGYGNFEGPNDNRILFRHGVGLTHPQKIRILKPFTAQPGHTYHLDYVYDTQARFLELIVFEGGVEVARLGGTPNVSTIAVDPGDQFVIDLGFIEGVNENEMATYGWSYRDISIDFLR